MPDYDVVLLPTFSQVEDWRKRQAEGSEAGLFSQAVTTFDAWIADLWELHGDGRAIISSLQRRVIVQAALERLAQGRGWITFRAADAQISVVGDEALAPPADAITLSAGVTKLVADCMRDAAGLPAFEQAMKCVWEGQVPDGFSMREAALLQGMACSIALAREAGFVELGQAAASVAACSSRAFPHPLRVLRARALPLSWIEEHFFASCESIDVTIQEAPGVAGVEPLAEGIELRFGFPSGRYAQPALVADLARRWRSERGAGSLSGKPDVIVACKDPLSLYDQLEPALSEDGWRMCVQARVPFSSTDFGRTFLSLSRVLSDDEWAAWDLSDAVLPPFSGFGPAQAVQVDCELRMNRLAERDDCLKRLRMSSDAFSQLEELASDPDADILLGVFEQIAYKTPGKSDAWRTTQLAAATAMRSCTSVARRLGVQMGACVQALQDAKVTTSFQSELSSSSVKCSADVPTIVITTQDAASQMGEKSCAHLILCDLTSQDYPVLDRDDAAATLFSKLGLRRTDSALARTRRAFAALQALPTARLTCCRPLNDWEGSPTYPAAVLQELVDAYRIDATAEDDIDEVFGLTDDLAVGLLQRGEEDLYANEVGGSPGEVQPCEEVDARQSLGFVDSQSRDAVVLERQASGKMASIGFSPSASQIEAYLECPYKWFAQSRLNVKQLDEGFGALERGTFAHGVLHDFYERFQAEGTLKVDASNLEQARELMRAVCDEVEEAHRALDPGDSRYVAIDSIEQREIEALKAQLVSYLDYEARLLPGFHPAFLEYEIGPEDGASYAGHAFVGVVDRIDVDDKGRAVVIDYKGSVGPAHEIAGKGPDDPGNVQTRIYAQVIRRLLGLEVVAALYVSYGRVPALAGAYDGRVLEAAHLPGMKHEKHACVGSGEPDEPVESCAGTPVESQVGGEAEDFSRMSFEALLDRTEELVAQAEVSMESGFVEPQPRNAKSCEYCPVANCPKRGA